MRNGLGKIARRPPAAASVRDFLSILSHELRTTLAAMQMWTEVLRSPAIDEATRLRAIDGIASCVELQAALIDHVADGARATSGGFELVGEPIDCALIVGEAFAAARAQAEAKRLTFVADIATVGVVLGDGQRIRQIVDILIDNAIKFTPGGGRVEVVLARGVDSVALRVCDSGEGIDPASLSDVLDGAWQRERAPSQLQRGLGFGLAIARELVRLHGGSIRAESPGLGLGATFTVELPVAATQAAVVADAAPDESPPSLSGLTVLVVEDDEETREGIDYLLRLRGMRVVAVGSADAGLRALAEKHPDLLLCDLSLPGADGYSFIRKVRSLAPRHGGTIPAAAFTAENRDARRRAALDGGFDRYVTKPFDFSTLIQVLTELSRLR